MEVRLGGPKSSEKAEIVWFCIGTRMSTMMRTTGQSKVKRTTQKASLSWRSEDSTDYDFNLKIVFRAMLRARARDYYSCRWGFSTPSVIMSSGDCILQRRLAKH